MGKPVRWTLAIVVVAAGLVVAASIPLIGFGFLKEGIDRMGGASALSDHGRYTLGIVRDTRAKSRGPGSTRKKEVLVQFTATDRTTHSAWMSGDQDVGAAVRVHYDPRDPETATTGSVTGERVAGITRIVGGALLGPGLLLAYAAYAWSRLRDLRAPEAEDPDPAA